jgi:hypothetical protein
MMKVNLLLLCLSMAWGVVAQETAAPRSMASRIDIRKIAGTVTIDGYHNEPDWLAATEAGNFALKFPTDIGQPKRQTLVKVLFDDKFVYFAITCQDSTKAFIQSLKRDIGHDGNDGVAIVLDPLNQKSNGFWFVVNAYNAQSEGLLNGNAELDMSWDNKWFSATRRFEGGWSAEIAIPFKTLRYKPDNKDWGVNIVRIDTKANEYSVWSKVPVNFRTYDMGYTGVMSFPQFPPAIGGNASLIPYVIGGVNSDKDAGMAAEGKFNAGFDAKLSVSSSLNLDFTVNPDFSQVEVDRQVTNLTRFNIFFPERRTFFLENADLFADYGYESSRPFYSRRIGVDDENNTVPIYGGVRLTGNLGEKTRIGILDIQTGRRGDFAGQNYAAFSVKQRVQKRSSVNAYFLNRQAFNTAEENKAAPLSMYGRNAGVEYNFLSESGKWSAWNAWHLSFKPQTSGDNIFFSTGAKYDSRRFMALQDFTQVGTNYYTDMGFMQRIENYDALRDTVIRLGYKHSFTELEYRWFPQDGFVNQHNLNAENYLVMNPDNSFNEWNAALTYEMSFRNTSGLNVQMNHSVVNLLFPISFTDGQPLPVGYYRYTGAEVFYNSDFRKPLSVELGAGYGGFYNGTNRSLSASLNFRKLPHVNLALRCTYNNLVFPEPYGRTDLVLIAPQVEINFTTQVFWTTFIQFNSQRNNLNINSRFQWRFRPMSDLFLVYTDNYYTDPLMKNRSRGVVLKLNYWLNL